MGQKFDFLFRVRCLALADAGASDAGWRLPDCSCRADDSLFESSASKVGLSANGCVELRSEPVIAMELEKSHCIIRLYRNHFRIM